MSSIKKLLIKGMNSVMLDCDTATLLITKEDFVKLSCREQVQLKMHLISCKLCRRFKSQMQLMDSYLQVWHPVDSSSKPFLHLSNEQKEKMKKKLMNVNQNTKE